MIVASWVHDLAAGLASSTPSPSPDPVADQPEGLGVSATVMLSLVSAIVGAVLTLVGEALVRSSGEKRFGVLLVKLLGDELHQVATASAPQAALDGLYLHPPLPTAIWQSIRASRHLGRLKPGELEAVVSAYVAIESANYQTAQLPFFMQVSVLSANEDVAREFRSESSRLSAVPRAEAHRLAVAALSALGRELDD